MKITARVWWFCWEQDFRCEQSTESQEVDRYAGGIWELTWRIRTSQDPSGALPFASQMSTTKDKMLSFCWPWIHKSILNPGYLTLVDQTSRGAKKKSNLIQFITKMGQHWHFPSSHARLINKPFRYSGTIGEEPIIRIFQLALGFLISAIGGKKWELWTKIITLFLRGQPFKGYIWWGFCKFVLCSQFGIR